MFLCQPLIDMMLSPLNSQDTTRSEAGNYLVIELWKQSPILQKLHDDSISKAKAAHGLILTAQRSQQAIIATASTDCSQHTLPVKALKDNACITVLSACNQLAAKGASAYHHIRS